MTDSKIIGITGGSGAGKTRFAKHLVAALQARQVSAVLIGQDRYYKDFSHTPDDERGDLNFDEPDAFDMPLYQQQLRTLKGGEAIKAPYFDYVGLWRRDEADPIDPADIILTDGLFLLHDNALADILDASIYLDVPDDIRLIRRIRRDVHEYEIALDTILNYWERILIPMHEQYVFPAKDKASLILNHNTADSTKSAVQYAVRYLSDSDLINAGGESGNM